MYKQSGKLVDTRGEPKGSKWIFVLSTSKTLYIGQKNKGTFQHSSFLAGGATLSAGRLNVEDGILKVGKAEIYQRTVKVHMNSLCSRLLSYIMK